jgi:5-methylcytosine-specific restriction protein A
VPRNEAWTPEELILALDLYFRLPPNHSSSADPQVISLSRILNLMNGAATAKDASYRNANSVYMKMRNFLRFDPTFTGAGLKKGGKLEAAIWKGFADDRALLKRTAKLIRTRAIGKRQLEAL